MITLAIHPGHNSTAVLMREGKILAALSQEKLDNVKNSAAFPKSAIEAILRQHKVDVKNVDQVVISGAEVFPARCYDYLFDSRNEIKSTPTVTFAKRLEQGIFGKVFPFIFTGLRSFNLKRLRSQGLRELKQNLKAIGLHKKPLHFVDHHRCHARAAYHGLCAKPSAEKALVFTLDGSGDGLCATVSIAGPNGHWETIAETPQSASLGNVYSHTTRFLGMKILEHEYKVMGLAAYCKGYHLDTYERLFKDAVDLSEENPLEFASKFDTSRFCDHLIENAVCERFDNVAGAVQHLIEERVLDWIKASIKKTGIDTIYTGGGVFMNVKLNKRIQELPEVKRVHFMPSCGDESNPFGAAYDFAISKGLQPEALDHIYLGLAYSNEEIEKFIEENNLRDEFSIEFYDNIEDKIADLLSSREIVARFSGPCEWGARSLGNRAILAHPSYMESFYTVNDLIKCRDFWMPFAPSMLDSYASQYLEDYSPEKAEAPYMITAFQASKLGVEKLRAALHQGDHTLRPQVVRREANPTYYGLIEKFAEKTGVGAVLNTSFNLHGYPLVATPEQAITTLGNSGLQHLSLENYLLSKKG